MAKRIEIIGGKELLRALRAIEEKLDKSLEEAAVSGAELIEAEARQRAPYQTGQLRDSIMTEVREKAENKVEVAVGPNKKEGWYGLLIEFGVGQHLVKPDQAKALQTGPDSFAARARPGGFPGKPFMRPAWDQKQEAVVETIAKILRKKAGLNGSN